MVDCTILSNFATVDVTGPSYFKNTKCRRNNRIKKPDKGLLLPSVLEPLLPRVFAVITDNDNYRLVIDGFAVCPLGIF